MKLSKGRLAKVLALTSMLACCLLLTSCVVPADDISTNGNYVVNSNDLPFQSLGPTITNTPYVAPATSTPTTVPTRNPYAAQQATATPTVNIGGIGVGTTSNVQQTLPNITPQIIVSTTTATPATSTSSTLKNGSTGSEVKKLQQRLIELGYLKGSADGDFGDATETAVKNFQANNGLTVDGKAGSATLAKVYSSSARKAATTTATNTPKPTNTPFTSFKNGDSGADVRKMQQRLKELGYLKGSADGDFGDATEAAVKAFQANNGLTVDGKAGNATLTKLYSSSARKASTATATPKVTNTPKATNTPNPSDLDYYLKIGSSGAKVKTLQNRLIELGWLDGKADGSYGNATEYAVKAFQARYTSLWTDGVAGPDTLKILYGKGAATSKTPVATLGISLERGDQSDTVKALQNRLKELGYFKSTVDGKFGSSTEAAVIAFQTANSITASGKATTATMNKLFSASAKDAASYEDEENAKQEEDDEEDDSTINGYTTLRYGDKGTAVKALQQALKKRGYYDGKLDSIFDQDVQTAVKVFQTQNGLKVDGVAGPATQSLLFGAGGSDAVSYTTLKKGSSGTAVRNLQQMLYELGYYDDTINGEYGDSTYEAIRAFQINNDLTPVDGVAGKQTLQVIYSGNAVGASAASGTFATLSKGDKGTAVVNLQEVLYKLGYLSDVTGEYDSATVEAVKNLQRRNNLTVTGKANQELQRLVYFGEPTPAW